MRRTFGLVVAAVLALALAAPATAEASVYHYTATANTTDDVDIYLTTSNVLNGLGGYDLLSATGTILGNAITGVVPPSGTTTNDGSYVYDNTYFALAPFFDYNGWLLSSLAGNWNPYFDSDSTSRLYISNGSCGARGCLLTNISSVNTPEPITLALMGTGLIGLGFMVRRKSCGAMMATPA